MNLQRLTLEDAATRLGFVDRRAAERWCRSHGIKIYCEKRRKFIMDADLNMILQTTYIGGIKERYPEKYKEIYKAWVNEDYLEIYQLMNGCDDTKEYSGQIQTNKSTYVPKSKGANDFLKDFNNYE